jgi:hypothetical protein
MSDYPVRFWMESLLLVTGTRAEFLRGRGESFVVRKFAGFEGEFGD